MSPLTRRNHFVDQSKRSSIAVIPRERSESRDLKDLFTGTYKLIVLLFYLIKKIIRKFLIQEKAYYVYFLTNPNLTVLYIGVTADLISRVARHKEKCNAGFTKKYNVTRLVYYELFDDISDAIGREKQLKKWSRKKKNFLVNKTNPLWKDLYLTFTA